MNEREVLKLAAKAAGYWDKELKCYTGFDPLIDDGDALRLVVSLGMTLYVDSECSDVCAKVHLKDGRTKTACVLDKEFTKDPYAATRRAIVRAAAEIGKGMK